jgi:hypothetical protein
MHNAQRVPTDTVGAPAMLSFGQSRIVPDVLRFRDRSGSVKVDGVIRSAARLARERLRRRTNLIGHVSL